MLRWVCVCVNRVQPAQRRVSKIPFAVKLVWIPGGMEILDPEMARRRSGIQQPWHNIPPNPTMASSSEGVKGMV